MIRLKTIVFLASLIALGATLQPRAAHACEGSKHGAEVSGSADKASSQPVAADKKDAAPKASASK